MSLPIGLHSNKYLERLRDFRDQAFDESHWLGTRRRIGGFTFGQSRAEWQSETGGFAYLIDEGLRYKGNTVSKLLPTTLRLYNSQNEYGLEVVTFKMDIDDVGCIDIYRNMITNGSFREIARAELSKRADRKHGLSELTDEDRELLYTEMQRGATLSI